MAKKQASKKPSQASKVQKPLKKEKKAAATDVKAAAKQKAAELKLKAKAKADAAKAALAEKKAAAKAKGEAKKAAGAEKKAKAKAKADAKKQARAEKQAAVKAKADAKRLAREAKANAKATAVQVKAEARAAKVAAKAARLPVPTPSAPTGRSSAAFLGPTPDKPLPRGSKLPPVIEALTKREMEQVLTVGNRGVQGEGSLKGRLIVHGGFPYLEVIGRDKRELLFLLQGPDQEVLPAYSDHKVSISGQIRRTNNHGGVVDVRKYSAKKPEVEVVAPEPVAAADKLRYLSPGEVEQLSSAGMGAGMKGFAAIRGTLEMAGEDFFLVVSAGGTRQQVSFLLEGKNAKGLKRNVGNTLHVTGVVEKTAGWGGTIQVETCEPRIAEHRPVARDAMDVLEVSGSGSHGNGEVKLNHGLSVRLPEKAGYIWAVEPTIAKRVGLREANFEPKSGGGAYREFFFTPRNPGPHEIEFFLAKAFNPMQVSKSYKFSLNVKSPEMPVPSLGDIP